MGQVLGTVKESISDIPDKARDAAHEIADRVEDALHSATVEGRRLNKKVRKELRRRWEVVDKTGRDNAYVMALGALGIGVVIGYLIARNRD